MTDLTDWLSSIIRERVSNATQGLSGKKFEYRLIFRGPPLEILEPVFEELARTGGIHAISGNGSAVIVPVLLQYPTKLLGDNKLAIGVSGKCDKDHLLDVRNDPNNSCFVALVPAGQHNNLSIESASDVFGLSTNPGAWWEDGFVQQAVSTALQLAGITTAERDDSIPLIRAAAASIDGVDPDQANHAACWRMLSRLFSIQKLNPQLLPANAVNLACGFPPSEKGKVASKVQLNLITEIADELADGFKTGIDRLALNASSAVNQALNELLIHLKSNCDLPTAFERSTQAFYSPDRDLTLTTPPSWWNVLTLERWQELLSDSTLENEGQLDINCSNSLVQAKKGFPAIVRQEVDLCVTTGESSESLRFSLTGGSFGKNPVESLASNCGSNIFTDQLPSRHSSPLAYKAMAENCKPATVRVISLESWKPGIVVTCIQATKFAHPKKPSKKNVGYNWESALSLPSSGRYTLTIFLSTGANLIAVDGVQDDATEQDSQYQPLNAVILEPDKYRVEIEAEGKYQVDVRYSTGGDDVHQHCRVYLTCEEVKEEGCRSEFERLIKLNRHYLERFDTKTVVNLDRNARSSTLQSWLLEEQNAINSYMPLVIAQDYVNSWAPPDWCAAQGPVMSKGRFLHDPRPDPSKFTPPKGFLDSRLAICKKIHGDDQSGLIESATLGAWLSEDPEFRTHIETYLNAYMSWLKIEPEIACWIDTIAVCAFEADGRRLNRSPEAILLSPLHPLRLAWHCLAQSILRDELESTSGLACPAASILDPDCVPDCLTMYIQSPSGVVQESFVSVECSSDYWSVLWNGKRLGQLPARTRKAPFDTNFGLTVGGISSGFSPAQVSRALDDVTSLLAAKPIISLVVDSEGGTTDACNDGLTNWCTKRFGTDSNETAVRSIGAKILEVYDIRTSGQPDQATIANLSQDTDNQVRWYTRQPEGAVPDLGIIAQLDSAEPEAKNVGMLSPLSFGGLIRHRVRRQLEGSFLSESRQALQMPPSGEAFADKVAACMLMVESLGDTPVGLQFSPSVHPVSDMLQKNSAGYVAVSSSAIDPACFLGGWIEGTFLWDYDLPAYSHRAGDTSGYYLLSQIKEADRDALRRVLKPLPECMGLGDAKIEQILLEVARRGIPTVRGISGDGTGATGDLGLFLAVRLLQDQFRIADNFNSLLPVLSGTSESCIISVIIPVDPFRGYLSDLSRTLSKEHKDTSLSRPDLLVIGVSIQGDKVDIRITPIEVKYRQGSAFGSNEALEALDQAKALSRLFKAIESRAENSVVWRVAYQHLLLSMVGFGLRVYSQHQANEGQSTRWAIYHEKIAAAILGTGSSLEIDMQGRLIVIDNSELSSAIDRDGDGFAETIVISDKDAGRLIAQDNPQPFYDSVRAKVADWRLLPEEKGIDTNPPSSSSETVSPDFSAIQNPENHDTIETPGATMLANPTFPETKQGIVMSLGQTVDSFEAKAVELNISDTRLNQLNIGVAGDLGTGKTQFLKSLISQISSAAHANRGIKPRFLIFDYKNDFSTDDFVAATGAKVVKPRNLPLNLFDTSDIGDTLTPWLERYKFFADVLDKVYSGIGPVQRDKLKGAVRNAYEAANAVARSPTLYDIHREYRAILGEKSDSPMAIIDDLVDMEIFTRNPEKTIPFDEFLDGVVVISLTAMGQDDRSKNMLVAIFLNMFFENMKKTVKRPFIGNDPQLRAVDSYLLVDEAHNIMPYEFDILKKILLEGREFGTGVILASQFLKHFKAGGTDYRAPLLSWFIHKVPNITPTELGALGFTSDLTELSERVKTLPNHYCLYKSYNVSGVVIRGLPFYELVQDSDINSI